MKKTSSKKQIKTGDNALGQVQQFYQFMNTNKLETIEFSKDDVYIKLVRKPALPMQAQMIPVFAPDSGVAANQNTPQQPVQQQVAAPSGETIKSPMTGIFYRAPSPSSPPYAREGDIAKKGQLLYIIEAMKVFNEIKCDYDCQIIKVLVENGKPIKANQDIFLVKKK